MKALWLLGLCICVASCGPSYKKADLIVTNANIWTGNKEQPHAQAMAISSDRIIAIGTIQEIDYFKGEQTVVIDAKKAFVTPGFIDSHVHMLTGGRSLLSVELRDAITQEEFTNRIANFASQIESGTWILEGNWDHTLWGGELPKKEWIDPFTAGKPVCVYRLDGHMVLANSAALAIAGIDKNTPDVEDGVIVRYPDGSPTGVLKSNAMNLLLDKIPPMNDDQKMASLKAAMNYFASNGVTTVHDVDSLGTYSIADKLRDSDELLVRIYAIEPLYRWKEQVQQNARNDEWLKKGGVKGFIDGSLGSHTAAFHHDYSDKENDKGLIIFDMDDLQKWVLAADENDLQVMVHAIGDRAIHELLNVFEKVENRNGVRDRRFRIEHVQHIAEQDISRLADLKVIASMQPYHAIDDGRWAEEVIGPERVKTTYAFNSIHEAGAQLAFGSDWAVAPASPLYGIFAAVTRRTLDGANPDGWVPEQKISVEDALVAYTRNAAYASFDEGVKGTLEPGKLADFILISDDITKVDPVRIKDLKILETYVGGNRVYAR